MRVYPEDVHPRRRESYVEPDCHIEYWVRKHSRYRGIYETQFGVPADPDLIWAARDAEYQRRNPK